MTTATTDAKIAELQRNLAASNNTISRLEHELSSAKASAAAERARRPQSPRTAPAQPAPPPAPPPAPAPASPGLKASLAAATTRVDQLEAELRTAHGCSNNLRSEVRSLEAELSKLRSAPSSDMLRASLGKARSELEFATAELERERERRRSLERRLNDTRKPSGPFRVPEPPPPPRPFDAEEERIAAEQEAQTLRLLKTLDGRMGKLEHRKETEESRLLRENGTRTYTRAQRWRPCKGMHTCIYTYMHACICTQARCARRWRHCSGNCKRPRISQLQAAASHHRVPRLVNSLRRCRHTYIHTYIHTYTCRAW